MTRKIFNEVKENVDSGTESESALGRAGGGAGLRDPWGRPGRCEPGRRAAVYGPGGYSWRPTAGDKVLVLKAGAEGETPCLLGVPQEETGLKPGEVRLKGGESSVFLGQDRLELEGSLYLNGQTLWDVVEEIVIALLG